MVGGNCSTESARGHSEEHLKNVMANRPCDKMSRMNFSSITHDLFPAEAWAAFRAGAGAVAPRRARDSRRGFFDERVDLPFFNIQFEGGEQAADRGEFGKVIVGHDGNVEVAPSGGVDRHVTGVVRRERGGLLDVRGECLRRKGREIIRVHPCDEVLQDVAVDALTERSQGCEDLIAVCIRVRHDSRGVYLKVRSLCRKNCASIMRCHDQTFATARSSCSAP